MLELNCCKTMEAELTAWKANVYDIVRKMEELPGGERDKFLPNIEDLHILIAEMDDRIDQIRKRNVDQHVQRRLNRLKLSDVYANRRKQMFGTNSEHVIGTF